MHLVNMFVWGTISLSLLKKVHWPWGKLYLIPTVIAEDSHKETLTSPIKKAIQEIDIFIVENIKYARRNIKKIFNEKNIDRITFLLNGKHDKINLEKDFLGNILLNKNIGLLSDAGLPCIADPGAKIVSYAHEFQIDVIPLVGPSSIFLALMSSGFNGQNFTFNGYLPIEKRNRIISFNCIKYFIFINLPLWKHRFYLL